MKTIISIVTGTLLLISFYSFEPERVVVSARYSTPYYVRPPQPYHTYIWIEGDWYIQNGIYVYKQGYWAPPKRNKKYHPGEWRRSVNGWYWKRGRWH